MDKDHKLFKYIMMKRGDANVPFDGLCQLLKGFGFEERIKGDHRIFTRSDVEEIINLQPIGSKGKPYQVKQVRNLFFKYGIQLGE